MMSSSYIAALADDAGRRAKRNGVKPLQVPDDWDGWSFERRKELLLRIPFTGSYVPKGFTQTDRPQGPGISDACATGCTLVDKGWLGDQPDGRCLTVRQFTEWARPGYYYSILEEGQFQVVVGEFQQTGE